jgi:crossover junction endodeoxyribonuclease RusA
MTPDGGAFVFVVQHRAAPQGSKDLQHGKGGKAYMVESSKAVKPFRTAVKRAALGHDGRPMVSFTGAVKVSIEFEFVRPASNQDEHATTKNTVGDIDKLTRAVLDALTEAQVIEDDRFVVQVEASKWWADEDQVFITVQCATPIMMRPVGPAIVSRVRRDNDLPPLAQSIVDFAQSIGVTVDPWQRYVLDEVVHHNPEAWDPQSGEDPPELPGGVPTFARADGSTFTGPSCCNTVDHKSCVRFGKEWQGACPCHTHCTA